MKKILEYFFRGLLLTVPFAATVYVIVLSLRWLDGLIPIDIPGLGLAIILVSITLLGYLGSTIIAGPVLSLFEGIIGRIPFVKLIYGSVKDLMEAFVGNKKKFNKPVMVTVSRDSDLKKLGFITQNDLELLHMSAHVAVYLPHSYNFSGNLFLVPREHVTPIDASGTDIMKFIVSGGVSDLEPTKR